MFASATQGGHNYNIFDVVKVITGRNVMTVVQLERQVTDASSARVLSVTRNSRSGIYILEFFSEIAEIPVPEGSLCNTKLYRIT